MPKSSISHTNSLSSISITDVTTGTSEYLVNNLTNGALLLEVQGLRLLDSNATFVLDLPEADEFGEGGNYDKNAQQVIDGLGTDEISFKIPAGGVFWFNVNYTHTNASPPTGTVTMRSSNTGISAHGTTALQNQTVILSEI